MFDLKKNLAPTGPLGFIECESPYDDTTHIKIIIIASNTESIYADINAKDGIVVAEIRSEYDIDEDQEKAFLEKYTSLGFEFNDGSRIAKDCTDGIAVISMTRENVSQDDLIEIAYKARTIRPGRTDFQKQLLELGFTHRDEPIDVEHSYAKDINIEFVSLNEFYAYEKQTGKTDWEIMTISFDCEIIDEIVNPKGKEFQEIIKQSSTKHFTEFGKVDISDIDSGNVLIEPSIKPLINNPEFLKAVNAFIQDTKHIFG